MITRHDHWDFRPFGTRCSVLRCRSLLAFQFGPHGRMFTEEDLREVIDDAGYGGQVQAQGNLPFLLSFLFRDAHLFLFTPLGPRLADLECYHYFHLSRTPCLRRLRPKTPLSSTQLLRGMPQDQEHSCGVRRVFDVVTESIHLLEP